MAGAQQSGCCWRLGEAADSSRSCRDSTLKCLFNLTPDWRVLGFTGAIDAGHGRSLRHGTRASGDERPSGLGVARTRRLAARRAPARLTSGLIVVQIALSVDARRRGWSLYPHVRTTAERSAGIRQRPRPDRNGRHRSRAASTPQASACRSTSVLPRPSVVCRGWREAAASTGHAAQQSEPGSAAVQG